MALPIYRLEIPTPFEVGPVNVYLINSQPVTLVDTGLETQEAEAALKAGLKEHSLNVGDIEQVIVTHSHIDHCGLAHKIKKASGARIFLHQKEWRKLGPGFRLMEERSAVLGHSGIPAEIAAELTGQGENPFQVNLATSDVNEINDGDVLAFSDFTLQALHLPGHSSGHICLYEPEYKVLLSGDFLLKEITPNPILETDPAQPEGRTKSLSQYLAGLSRLGSMDIRLVLPGHGDYIENPPAVIRRGFAHHESRLQEILGILHRLGEATIYEVVKTMYPNGLNTFNTFLAASEALAHLDLLMERGQVARRAERGTWYFHPL